MSSSASWARSGAATAPARATFTPLPGSAPTGAAGASGFHSGDMAHASQASGYAAGWAQGLAAAAEEERRVVAALLAQAQAERAAVCRAVPKPAAATSRCWIFLRRRRFTYASMRACR